MFTDIEGQTLISLSELAQSTNSTGLSSVLVDTPLKDFLDKLFFTQAIFRNYDDGFQLDLNVVSDQEIAISPTWLPVGLVIGSVNGMTVFALSFDVKLQDELVKLDAKLMNLPIALRIPSSMLCPLRPGTKEPDTSVNHLDLTLGNINLSYNSNENFAISLNGNISLPLCMVGQSGILIQASNIIPVFNPYDNPMPNLPSTFRGIIIESVQIYLPEGLPALVPSEIQVTNCLIGNGGFSGNISGTWSPQLAADNASFTGNGAGNIFGIPFALKEVAIEFKQNTLIESKIAGIMILPFFDQPVICEIRLTTQGDFTVALSADQTFPPSIPAPEASDDGLYIFTKQDLLKLKLKSIQFNKLNDVFSIQLGGAIKPLFGGLDWPEVDVKALTIDSRGHVKVDGGWLEIPKQKSLDFHGFKLELSKIGFGKENDGSRWIGLSGGINIVNGVPLKGAVDGLKIIWKDTGNIRLQISGIKVAFEIEDVLNFDGVVYFIDEPTKKGFKGGVKLTIHPLNGMLLDAQFIAGRNLINPPFNFFYIFIGADLPIGIPLGSTGASLYGMAGLFGYNMYPSKALTEAWYEDDMGNPGWYKKAPIGISGVEKWVDSRDKLALGAGITLGTADNGFTFSGKVLLVVLIPGPMVLVEGKAQFLKERKGLDEDPIFRLLAVLDAKAGTFLMNVAARYKYPNDGKVIDLSGGAEVFFNFNNPNAWHLYLGQDSPVAKRIKARVLSLFDANSFFMIDANSVLMGAWAGFDKSWKFGPLKVVLKACIEGILGLSYKPPQARGKLALDGDAQLKAFGKGIGISIHAGLDAKAPTPWYLRGEFTVKLKLPWPLPDPKAKVVLKWEEEREPPIPLVLAKIGIEHRKVKEKWELNKYPIYDSDKDGFSDSNISEPNGAMELSPIIPLDALPVLTFARPVEDIPHFGDNDNPPATPSAEVIGDYQYKYRLNKITIQRRPKNGFGSWSTFAEKPSSNSSDLIYGYWQITPGNEAKNIKLMMWANTPFEISRDLESNHSWLYSHLYPLPGYPCNIDTEAKKKCADFEALEIGKQYQLVLLHQDFIFYSENPSIPFIIVPYEYDDIKVNGLTLYNKFSKVSNMRIVFPENMGEVTISFSKNSNGQITKLKTTDEPIDDTKPFIANDEKPLVFEAVNPSEPINAVIISGDFVILKVCGIPIEEKLRVEQNQATLQYNKTAITQRWGKHEHPFFEPNSYYKLSIDTEAQRKKGNDEWKSFVFTEYAYFQTENPPGAYHPVADNEFAMDQSSEHYPRRGPLKDLSPYILHTIPLQAASDEPKNLAYRSYDIGVKFNEARGYVEQMYLMASLPMTIRLFDNNSQPVLTMAGHEIALENPWSENPELVLTREEKQWRKTVNTSVCAITLDYNSAKHSESFYTGDVDLVLNPSTLYKAKVFGGEFSLYEFNLITSKYCTFIHHIHSFANMLWDHHKLKQLFGEPIAETEINQGKLDKLQAELSGFEATENHRGSEYNDPSEEALVFENIAGPEVFDLGIRRLPEKVELLLLNDAVRSYGLLLESPEPLEWERIDFSVDLTSSLISIEESISIIKIIEAHVGNEAAINDEWVDILLQQPYDLSGIKIQYKNTDEADFSNYFTFSNESIFSAGSVIRVHSGIKVDGALPVEFKHRYITADNGNPSVHFNLNGEDKSTEIQLIDQSNNVLHRYSIVSNAPTKKATILLRNKDKTRAFCFFKSGEEKFSSLSGGRYSCHFNFKRKVDGNANLPVLKRNGSDVAETTKIEFSLSAPLQTTESERISSRSPAVASSLSLHSTGRMQHVSLPIVKRPESGKVKATKMRSSAPTLLKKAAVKGALVKSPTVISSPLQSIVRMKPGAIISQIQSTRGLEVSESLPWYTDADISTCVELKIKKLGGYKKNSPYRLSGIGEDGKLPDEDGNRYFVLVTGAIDIYGLANPIDYFLDKLKQPRNSLAVFLEHLIPYLEKLQTLSTDKGAFKEQLIQLLRDKISDNDRDDTYNKITEELAAMEFSKDRIQSRIKELDPRDRKDVFEEIAEELKQPGDIHIKILTPYNITQSHWLTMEIKIHKKDNAYKVELTAHDPYGGGEITKINYVQLCGTIEQQIKKVDVAAEVAFENIESAYSPRQQKSDQNSCGVIVVEDILKRVAGSALQQAQPYSNGAKELRLEHIQLVEESLRENDQTRIRFIKRHRSIGKNSQSSENEVKFAAVLAESLLESVLKPAVVASPIPPEETASSSNMEGVKKGY